MDKCQKIFRFIEGKTFLGKVQVDSNIDRILENRESPDFEEPWLNSYGKQKHVEVPSRLLDEIRQSAYQVCFERFGEPDLAAYVSDDLEMITKQAHQKHNGWVSGMAKCYGEGLVPFGKVEQSELGIIQNLLQELETQTDK